MFLAVHAGQIYVPITLTSLSTDQNDVFLLAIAAFTKASSALKFPPSVFTSQGMWYHSSAGVYLRSEIDLLHPTLLNPRGVTVVDQFTNHPPANANSVVELNEEVLAENAGILEHHSCTN